MKILIVEDDGNMQKILKMYLQKEGCLVDCVSDGESAAAYFETNHADLMILDWMLPGKDGLSVCREIRAMKLPVKIIMLTAKSTSDDELRGLLTGADDYVKKPFRMDILLIKIKKLCHFETVLHFRNITLIPDRYEVLQNQKRVGLTKKEYELLKFLMINKNQILSREQILNHVWGFDYAGDYRTVDTHIRRLRKKIGETYIQTRFGTGYIMEDIHE